MGISIHKQSLYDIENNKRTVKDYEKLLIKNDELSKRNRRNKRKGRIRL